jgi:hypothetical protein
MYSRTQPAPKSETTPVFKDIYIDGFTCEASPQAIYVMGLAEAPVENLTLKNIKVKGDKGARLENVVNFKRENVEVVAKTGETWEMNDVKEIK